MCRFSSGCDTDESLKSAFLLVKDRFTLWVIVCLWAISVSRYAGHDSLEFAAFGEVSDVHLPMDRETGRMRGFAFVTMATDAAAQAAIAGMNGKSIEGRPLVVNEARPAPAGDRPPRGLAAAVVPRSAHRRWWRWRRLRWWRRWPWRLRRRQLLIVVDRNAVKAGFARLFYW